MKSHEVAHSLQAILCRSEIVGAIESLNGDGDIVCALTDLAAILQRGPNAEIEHLLGGKRSGDVTASLKSLVALSKYDKQRWLTLIDEFGLPIELNVKASSRDIVGKVLVYLDAHPEALQIPKKTKQRRDSATLEDTLNKLINFK